MPLSFGSTAFFNTSKMSETQKLLLDTHAVQELGPMKHVGNIFGVQSDHTNKLAHLADQHDNVPSVIFPGNNPTFESLSADVFTKAASILAE